MDTRPLERVKHKREYECNQGCMRRVLMGLMYLELSPQEQCYERGCQFRLKRDDVGDPLIELNTIIFPCKMYE